MECWISQINLAKVSHVVKANKTLNLQDQTVLLVSKLNMAVSLCVKCC